MTSNTQKQTKSQGKKDTSTQGTTSTEGVTSTQGVPDTYDDELDEDFEEDLAKRSTLNELSKTLESFENPKGLEDEMPKESPLLDGPQINQKDIDKLYKKATNGMSKAQLNLLLANLQKNNNFGLGDKDNLSSVSDDHKRFIRTATKNSSREKSC